MLNKINKEIEEFTTNIKEVKGCDEMLTYMNSNIYSSIKLIMFASKTFSMFGKVMLFFIISLSGLLFILSLGSGALNIGLLSITLVLFVLILFFVMHYKNFFILSIKNKKSSLE